MSYAPEQQKPLQGPQKHMCNACSCPAWSCTTRCDSINVKANDTILCVVSVPIYDLGLSPLPHFIAYGLIGVPTALVTGSGGATRRNS
jgi:hypothetical protein